MACSRRAEAWTSAIDGRKDLNTTTAARCAYAAEFLPLNCYDPTAPKPYFIAARNGRPVSKFEDSVPGSRSVRQRIRYLPMTLKQHLHGAVRSLKRALAA